MEELKGAFSLIGYGLAAIGPGVGIGILLVLVLGYSYRDDAKHIYQRIAGELLPPGHTLSISEDRANGQCDLPRLAEPDGQRRNGSDRQADLHPAETDQPVAHLIQVIAQAGAWKALSRPIDIASTDLDSGIARVLSRSRPV